VSRFLFPLSEYNRIYQVVHGVRQAFPNSEKGCIFFAACGAVILSKHYKIPARPVAGGFAMCVNDTPNVVFFGEQKDGRLTGTPDGFHMWIQTETHIIDFMAPIFPEAFAEGNVPVPRKMFQREKSSEAASLSALNSPGDFFTLPDPELTSALLKRFLDRPSSGDLLHVADTWFGDRRRAQAKSIMMGDSQGAPHHLSLPRTIATGSW